MKWLKEQIIEFFYKYPVILVILILIIGIWFFWWMSQPVEIIYDPNAPPWGCDDDPEGGYFPRC